MPTLLQIDSSPMGEASISRRLTRAFAKRWLGANPQGNVAARDLAATPIPVIDAAWIAANMTPKNSRTQQQRKILALSTEFCRELLRADEYVIGTPMHNWGPSSNLKLWVDQIVHFGETLIVGPSGPKGALGGKRATFVIAAGRLYGPRSPYASMNYIEPWLRSLFGYLGVEEMQFLVADGAADILNGKIDREAFLALHIEAVEALFAAALQ
jgi:FMN-dependent NADH-azoreductase